MLWLVDGILGVSGMLLELFDSDMIVGIIAGEIQGTKITPIVMLVFAIIMLFPLFMALFTITCSLPRENRWTNILGGILAIILSSTGLGEFLLGIAEPIAHGVIYIIIAILNSALIIWYAWKWPKTEA